jgi:carbonic anhydrase
MNAVLKLVAILLAVILVAVFGTLSLVKSKQASEANQQLKQAAARIGAQKNEIETLKSDIDALHTKLQELQNQLAAAGGRTSSLADGIGVCPSSSAAVSVEPGEAGRPSLGIRYQSGVLRVLHTGSSLRVTAAPGGRLQFGAEMFDLRHIHLVRVESGLLNGRPATMAAHLVHTNAAGETVVVSVPLRESAFQNRMIWLMLNNFPNPGLPESTVANISIDPTQLLPDNRNYEIFRGSLPFAPCTPNVRFFQFANPVGISKDQVERFTNRVQASASSGRTGAAGAASAGQPPAATGSGSGAAASAPAPARPARP